jgi:NRAMP (natural resistance-associated macrophage protein)-like metal ion transporter
LCDGLLWPFAFDLYAVWQCHPADVAQERDTAGYGALILKDAAGKAVTAKTEKERGFWSRLGPGLVTGAADDDPSGIATHSQIGAQFGYSLSWTFIFSFPLMVVIQQIAAEIGSVTGRGIAYNLRRHYSPWLLRFVVLLLLIANIINLGADLGAMGAALTLLIGGNEQLYTLLFGHILHPARSLAQLSTLCSSTQMVDIVAFLLCRGHVCRACAMGNSP